jgi:hypothetical protein
MEIITMNGATLVPGAEAIINFTPAKDIFVDALTTQKMGKFEVVPWGDSNDLPNQVITKLEQSEVVGENNHFNTKVAYGLGLKAMMKQPDGTLLECTDQEVNDFFDNNDVNGWFLEQMNDIVTFFQPFSEIILDKAGNKIVQLRSKEALYSRWAPMDPNTGKILTHLYSAKWADGAKESDITATPCLDRYNPLDDLLSQAKTANKRFIVPVNMPSPGRPYYPRPTWWSMFNSGWFDYSLLIPLFKTAILKNKLAVKYIVYISDKYWEILYKSLGIDTTDVEKTRSARQTEVDRINTFLKADNNKGGGIVALKKTIAVGSTILEEKFIEITELKNDLKGGELIDDSQEVASQLCYAQEVHPNMIGTAPGKTGGSMSGTDVRERIMIKQSLMTPFRQRPLRVLTLIKKFNKWPDNIVFVVQDYKFTTLDTNKTGKEIQNNQ